MENMTVLLLNYTLPLETPQEAVSTTTPSFPRLETETWRGLEAHGRLDKW